MDLFGSGRGKAVGEAAAARFLGLRIGPEQQMSILAEAANRRSVGGKVTEDGLVGVASVEGDQEPAGGGGGIGVEVGAQITDLFRGALAEKSRELEVQSRNCEPHVVSRPVTV